MTIFNTPERQKIYRDIIKKLHLMMTCITAS